MLSWPGRLVSPATPWPIRSIGWVRGTSTTSRGDPGSSQARSGKSEASINVTDLVSWLRVVATDKQPTPLPARIFDVIPRRDSEPFQPDDFAIKPTGSLSDTPGADPESVGVGSRGSPIHHGDPSIDRQQIHGNSQSNTLLRQLCRVVKGTAGSYLFTPCFLVTPKNKTRILLDGHVRKTESAKACFHPDP